MNKKLKIFTFIVLGLTVVLIAVAAFGSKTEVPVQNGPLTSTAQTQSATTATSTPQSNEFATLLSSVKSISIDTSIFTNPAYKALRDNSVALGTDIVGRPNPFAAVGTDGGIATDAATVQTIQPGKITAASAELGALVTLPATIAASIVFQYGTTDAFGVTTNPIAITKSGTTLSTVSGLLPGTTYFVRAMLIQGSTTIPGNTMTFTTNAQAPRR